MTKGLRTKASVQDSENFIAVMRLAPKILKEMGRHFDRVPISGPVIQPSHLRALSSLTLRNAPTTMSDLASDLGITPGTLTNIVKHLASRKCLNRRRSPQDERVVLIEITELGQEIVRREDERVRQAFLRILENLTPDKQAEFVNAHRVLAEVLEEISQQERSER